MRDPTYRYTVTFEAGAVVEARVRHLLEATFDARNIALESELVRRPLKHLRLTPVEARIVELLNDFRAHRLKEIVAHVNGAASKGRVITLLQGLIDVEVVKKVRHGIYALADAPDELDVPQAQNDVPRESEARVLAWLSTPTLATEIRERLGVSRQRVDQILKSLERRSLVVRYRTTGEIGTFLYLRSDVKVGAALARRAPRLAKAKARLVSILKPDRLVRLSDAVERLGAFPHVALANARHLERHGLVTLFKLGSQTYVTLTPLGLAHPQYHSDDVTPAPSANVYEAFGTIRSAFLQVLHVLGPQRTLELTYAVPESLFEGQARSSGQFIQALENEGLVEPLSAGAGHARYALTARGALAAGLIGLAHPPPSAESLKALITMRRERRRARQGVVLP